MRTLGVAVVGSRGVGALHVAALHALPGVVVREVLGATPSAASGDAAPFVARESGHRWDDIFDADDIDVVHVCTPNSTHTEIAGAALRHRKHVVCEKPLAHTPADGRLLATLAERSSATSVLCHQYRFLPLAQVLRQNVLDGELGTIHGVRATYLQNWMLGGAAGWRADPTQVGRSRVLADIGTHLLDLVEAVTNSPVVSVAADFVSISGGQDDQVSLLMRLRDGAAVSAVLSQVSAAHANHVSLSIDGALGSAEWSYDGVERLVIVPHARVATLRLDDEAQVAATGTFSVSHGRPGGALAALLAAAYESIRGTRAGESMPLTGFGEGLRHLELIDVACTALDDSDLRSADRLDTSSASTARR